jgi:hypothetical protein
MHNEKLVEHLYVSREMLECSSNRESSEDSKGMTYLYFSPIQERLSLHVDEKYLTHKYSSPFAVSLTQRNQDDLLDFRPYFDAALTKKKISSISSFPIPHIENYSHSLNVAYLLQLNYE